MRANKGKGKHVRQQVVILFGSVAKRIVGSNINMPSNQWDDLNKKILTSLVHYICVHELCGGGGVYFPPSIFILNVLFQLSSRTTKLSSVCYFGTILWLLDWIQWLIQ